MPDGQEVIEVEETSDEFDAAFAEKAEQVEKDDPAENPGEVGTIDAGEKEADFNDSYEAATTPAAEPEEKEVDLSDELEKTKAEVERLKQSDRSQRGRVSALTKKLVDQQAANLQPPKGEEEITADSDGESNEGEDWEEFQREFPEMAAIVDKRLSSVTKQVDTVVNKVEKVATTQDILVEKDVKTYKAAQFDELQDRHSDFEEIKTSKEFAEWTAKAPAETLAKIKSHHADDAADVLDTFKKETGWGEKPADTGKSDVELLNEKRKKALDNSAGIPSKKVGRTTRQDTEDTDDFDSAFAEGARKKEKQRSARV